VWVEGGDIHDELLDQLGGVLAPPGDLELTPSSAELEALAAAVAARWAGGASAPASESQTGPVRHLPPAARPWRRVGSSAWRAGSVAAGLVLFSASAAAAASGVPLPRPVRVVAYNVGLPVDSPALDDANHHVKELKDAVKAQDKPKAQATAKRLFTDLTKVPAEEKNEAEQKAQPVIQQAVVSGLIPSPTPPTTAPPAPSTTTATTSAPTTTDTTGAPEKEKDKDGKDKPAATTTTTTAPETTTTTAPDGTTTTTAPSSDPSSGGGSPSGDPGAGSGDPSAGGAGTTGSGQGSTTPTTTPDTTTSTTAPASTGGDPTTTTTTTTEPPATTTTTTAPASVASTTEP
jgi:hypothetical protein